ncbi:MAG: GerAB/ArcD/ProY family transporter [Firmicutes bacterium]|nr:GerAB/ArcD/ProY family transporter [Bacillota bacterium]
MPSDNRDISTFKVAAMYTGAVIGAGFASGQEIMRFFAVHGNGGVWGVLLAALLLAYLGAATLYLSVRFRTNNYISLVSRLTGPWVGKLIDALSIIMLLAGLSVMLAGSGAVCSQYMGTATWPGVAALAVINCLVLTGGVTGVLRLNSLLVPVKIIAITAISLLIILIGANDAPAQEGYVLTSAAADNWFFSSVLYVSYNMLLVVAVLTTLGDRISAPRAVAGGVAGGMGLGAAMAVLLLAELSLSPAITAYQVPVLYMADIMGEMFKLPVALLIWLAILTTAVANTHGLAARFATPGSMRYKLAGVGCTLLALPLARQDFDRLVGTLYPILGCAGLLLMVVLLAAPFIKR